MKRLLVSFVAGLLPAFILMLSIQISVADTATWKPNPRSDNWNRAENWNPETIPNGPSDTATFATSSRTAVSLSANTEVNGIVFSAGANAFSITAGRNVTLNISGVGITNTSGIPQNFVAARSHRSTSPGKIEFTDSATAGSLTFFTNEGSALNQVSGGITHGGITQFSGNSSGGNGTFINKGSAHRNGSGGMTFFLDNSAAGNSTVVNEPGTVVSANGSFTSFSGSATAGDATVTNNGAEAGGGNPGRTFFSGNSTAGNATFNNNGGVTEFGQASTAGNGTFTNQDGGFVEFANTATAGNGVFFNNGGTVGGGGGVTSFLDAATAANGTFIINGGTVSGALGGLILFFFGSPTAGNGTFIINGGLNGGEGGTLEFVFNSTGGTARVEVYDNGALDISLHNPPGISIGSIEGTGLVSLGALNLTVGSNDLSTTFSGVIQDGGIFGGTGASFTKIGAGKLVLRGANTYTGGTVINGGKLMINNDAGSGTGSGTVQVNAGILGGSGTIAGAVTLGTGSGPGVLLLPGKTGHLPGTLAIQSRLTFKSDATYKFNLNSNTVTSDSAIANGVTINSGAEFSFADLGGGTLTLGTVFTVIDNMSAQPIAGTFGNLPNGSTFTSNGNTYQVSYQGGDGNDLTLTVVP